VHKVHGKRFAVTDVESVFNYCVVASEDYLFRCYGSLVNEELSLRNRFEDIAGRREFDERGVT
jgi:hypothetical protein